jgi:negative regulator of replication initiation
MILLSQFTKSPKAQKPIGNGLYVMTNYSTDKKQQIIEQISKAFDMGLKVEKVSIL